MTSEEFEIFKSKAQVGFNQYIGLNMTYADENSVTCEMAIKEEYLNIFGGIHGGAIFTLADTVGGALMRANGIKAATSSSDMCFLRPAVGCEKIVGKSKYIKKGNLISVVAVDIYDDEEKQIAYATINYCRI